MTKQLNGKVLFSLAFVLLFAFLIFVTMGYNAKARMVPLVVLIPGLAFSVIQFGLDWRGKSDTKAKEKRKHTDSAEPDAEGEEAKKKLPPGTKTRRELVALAWLFGFFVAIVLFGLSIAIPLFVLTFMRFFGRESWRTSIIFAAGCFAFVYFVFVWLLQNELYQGILLPLLNQ